VPETLRSKILVVDDEQYIVEIAADFLEDEGYEVLKAYNGQAAIEIVREHPDLTLIFSDIKMPIMDGVEFLKEVHKNFSHIPIYMVSGYSSYTEKQIMEFGASGYISKPYAPDLLIEYAQKTCETRDTNLDTKLPSNASVYVLEDDEIDRNLFAEAFSQLDERLKTVQLVFFREGLELIKALKDEDTRPDLLILDINLPGISGFETLQIIRTDNLISSDLHVIILSSSTLDSDHQISKDLEANCFFKKPASKDAWWHVARAVHQSWLS
jgi:CheY-like chemotaxis protein